MRLEVDEAPNSRQESFDGAPGGFAQLRLELGESLRFG